jgi:hypothetical protein
VEPAAERLPVHCHTLRFQNLERVMKTGMEIEAQPAQNDVVVEERRWVVGVD